MVKELAIKYIKSLNQDDRTKLKTMLENNVQCCKGYAKDFGVDVAELNAELKRIFEL